LQVCVFLNGYQWF